MTTRQVLLAPVPGEHIASACEVPGLLSRVAFGSSKAGIENAPVGIAVFIYVSQPSHRLYRRGFFWGGGTLGEFVPAVKSGRRSGKHPDPSVRPPTAETADGPFLFSWEVESLHQLREPP